MDSVLVNQPWKRSSKDVNTHDHIAADSDVKLMVSQTQINLAAHGGQSKSRRAKYRNLSNGQATAYSELAGQAFVKSNSTQYRRPFENLADIWRQAAKANRVEVNPSQTKNNLS